MAGEKVVLKDWQSLLAALPISVSENCATYDGYLHNGFTPLRISCRQLRKAHHRTTDGTQRSLPYRQFKTDVIFKKLDLFNEPCWFYNFKAW
ncbi:MAG: hypothetical protein WAU54_06645 [Chania sp.]